MKSNQSFSNLSVFCPGATCWHLFDVYIEKTVMCSKKNLLGILKPFGAPPNGPWQIHGNPHSAGIESQSTEKNGSTNFALLLFQTLKTMNL